MIPGLDIGMEYFYRNKFKEKLKSLYGFDYASAEKIKDNYNKLINQKGQITEKEIEYILNEGNITSGEEKYNSVDDLNISRDCTLDDIKLNMINEQKKITFTYDDFDKRSNNEKIKESEIESKISNEIDNATKNAGSIIRGIGEVGSVMLKALPTAGEITLESGAIAARAGISIGIKVVSWVFLPITCIDLEHGH